MQRVLNTVNPTQTKNKNKRVIDFSLHFGSADILNLENFHKVMKCQVVSSYLYLYPPFETRVGSQ